MKFLLSVSNIILIIIPIPCWEKILLFIMIIPVGCYKYILNKLILIKYILIYRRIIKKKKTWLIIRDFYSSKYRSRFFWTILG